MGMAANKVRAIDLRRLGRWAAKAAPELAHLVRHVRVERTSGNNDLGWGAPAPFDDSLRWLKLP